MICMYGSSCTLTLLVVSVRFNESKPYFTYFGSCEDNYKELINMCKIIRCVYIYVVLLLMNTFN